MYVIITIGFSLILGTLGFAILPGGELYGLLFALSYFVLSTSLFHKFLLNRLNVKELQVGHEFKALSDSICHQLKIGNVKIYYSPDLVDNLYLFDSWFDGSYLVVGRDLLGLTKKRSLRELLTMSYTQLKGKEVLRRNQVVWMINFLWMPIIILEKIFFLRIFSWIFKLILLPIVWLKNLLIVEQKVDGAKLENVGIYKSLKENQVDSHLIQSLLSDFSIIRFEERDLFSSLLDSNKKISTSLKEHQPL